MILFRMFISSDGLTSMSYMTNNQQNIDITEPAETCPETQLHGVRRNTQGSHSTHFPSKLLEDSAKLFLFLTLILLCIYSWPAWRRLWEEQTTELRVLQESYGQLALAP